jgi:hypothetical protein
MEPSATEQNRIKYLLIESVLQSSDVKIQDTGGCARGHLAFFALRSRQ